MTSNLVTLADELCKAAVAYAGDCGLHRDAWLWEKIEAYQAARATSETGVVQAWKCGVCEHLNEMDLKDCNECNHPRGSSLKTSPERQL